MSRQSAFGWSTKRHNRMTFMVAMLLAILGAARFSSARTYYVDSQAGRDSNTGNSSTAPWKTLHKVNSKIFLPGDIILLKSGSAWTGQLWAKGSGKPRQPIIIDKYGGETKPLIRGAGLVQDTVMLKNQEYWEIRNLEITNTGQGVAVRRGVNVAVENYGDAHHIYLRSLTIHDVNGTDTTGSGGIHYRCAGEIKPSRFIDLRIEDNRLYHVDRDGITGGSTHWERQKWYPSLGVVIRNNSLEDIGGDGIVNVATDGALVEYNVVGRANQRSKGNNVAIWAWSADNTIIQYNQAYATRGGHDSEGFDSDWNSRNTVIQYNYSHDNDGGFLLICNNGGVGPEYNVGNVGTIVRYNISRNDHNKSISIAGPTNNSIIYNNTIYLDKGETADLLSYSDWAGWADDTHYYNNIFYLEGRGRFATTISSKPGGSQSVTPGLGPSTNNVFDSNLYFGVEPLDDPHALSVDPMLVAPGAGDDLRNFGVQASSPAINSGKAIPGNGGGDILGTEVPLCGGTDRGAVESRACGDHSFTVHASRRSLNRRCAHGRHA